MEIAFAEIWVVGTIVMAYLLVVVIIILLAYQKLGMSSFQEVITEVFVAAVVGIVGFFLLLQVYFSIADFIASTFH